MFDSNPTRALTRELLAMTPGTNQFAQRLRAVKVNLDAEQARLDRAIDETNTRLGQKGGEDVLEARPGPAPRER
jgi:hypothetical protein